MDIIGGNENGLLENEDVQAVSQEDSTMDSNIDSMLCDV